MKAEQHLAVAAQMLAEANPMELPPYEIEAHLREAELHIQVARAAAALGLHGDISEHYPGHAAVPCEAGRPDLDALADPPSPALLSALDAVRSWPPTVSVTEAATVLGISERYGYELIRQGRYPCKVITVGTRHRVVTASLLALLEGDSPP